MINPSAALRISFNYIHSQRSLVVWLGRIVRKGCEIKCFKLFSWGTGKIVIYDKSSIFLLQGIFWPFYIYLFVQEIIDRSPVRLKVIYISQISGRIYWQILELFYGGLRSRKDKWFVKLHTDDRLGKAGGNSCQQFQATLSSSAWNAWGKHCKTLVRLIGYPAENWTPNSRVLLRRIPLN